MVMQENQAQAYLLPDVETYLAQRTADPGQPIGEAVGEFVDIHPIMGQWTLIFTKDGTRRKVKCRDIWGFTYKGVLFRINEEGPIPVRLMTEGTVCYYENGFAHLFMQREGKELAEYEVGHASYLSMDLKSPIVPAFFTASDARSTSARFRREHPILEPMFRCMEGHEGLDTIRQCVVDFEAGLLGDR